MGRPTRFTPALFDAIALRLAFGESMRGVCRDPAMPHRATVLRWLAGSADLRCTYAVAADLRGDLLFDAALDVVNRADRFIADEGTTAPARSAMRRLDERGRALARMAPRRFG